MFAGELRPTCPEALNQMQKNALQHASEYELAHGANFPPDLIASFCPPRSLVVEFGAASGEKLKALGDRGIRAYGIELNPKASDLSYEDFHNPVFRGDVRSIGQGDEKPGGFYLFLEEQDGVLIQALFANMLVDKDICHTIRTADAFLRPKGYIFIAEPIHYSELSLFPFKYLPEYTSQHLEQWQQKWLVRYRVNEEAGLPHDVFAVAQSGELSKEQKMRADWDEDPEHIKYLIDSFFFERYARHTRFLRLQRYLKRYHFAEMQTWPTVMYDRCGNPLIGVVSVWQKETAHYKYRPYLRGARYDDEKQQSAWVRRETVGYEDPQHYIDHYLELAKQFLPPSIQ